MTRSLENLFDEPKPESTAKAPAGGEFDALLDSEEIDTKGAIDPSWDKVRNTPPATAPQSKHLASEAPSPVSSLEEDGLDDLMGMSGTNTAPKPKRKIEGLPPEPSLSSAWGSQRDGQASFPWWVIVAAVLLILAGAAAVVTFA